MRFLIFFDIFLELSGTTFCILSTNKHIYTMKRIKLSEQAISGFFIGLGLLTLGFVLRNGLIEFKNKDRVVTVKGLAEKEVKSDKVIWPLAFKEVGDDLIAIHSGIQLKNAAIIKYLNDNGIKDSEISRSAPEIIDMQAERYANNQARYRYNVTSVITVTTNKVDLVHSLMEKSDELIRQGIAITGDDYRFQKQFLFTKLNDIKPSLIQTATQNARASALKFAQDSESKLGKIKSADQGQLSISDRDANTPQIKTIRVVSTIVYYLED